MPSSSVGVMVWLIYWRTGAPWMGASEGMVNPAFGSGWADAALEPLPSASGLLLLLLRMGVPTRGDGALLLLLLLILLIGNALPFVVGAVVGAREEAEGSGDCFEPIYPHMLAQPMWT
jgi:hypothetical protein